MENNNDGYEEIKSKAFNFGGVGDFIKGTLTDISKTTSQDKYGKLSHIYSVRAEEGSFLGTTKNEKTGKYDLNKEPTIINKGEDYAVFIRNDKGIVIGKMKDIVLGQKFKIQLTELKPTNKGNDLKVISVFAGKNADGTPLLDKEFLASKEETLDEVVNDMKS